MELVIFNPTNQEMTAPKIKATMLTACFFKVIFWASEISVDLNSLNGAKNAPDNWAIDCAQIDGRKGLSTEVKRASV